MLTTRVATALAPSMPLGQADLHLRPSNAHVATDASSMHSSGAARPLHTGWRNRAASGTKVLAPRGPYTKS